MAVGIRELQGRDAEGYTQKAHQKFASDVVTLDAPGQIVFMSGTEALARGAIRLLSDQKMTPPADVTAEEAVIEAGVIDVPFSPNRGNANRAIPARDWRGAVRFVRPGGVPLPKEIEEHYRDQVARRLDGARTRLPWELLLADVNAISDGRLLDEAPTPAPSARPARDRQA